MKELRDDEEDEEEEVGKCTCNKQSNHISLKKMAFYFLVVAYVVNFSIRIPG